MTNTGIFWQATNVALNCLRSEKAAEVDRRVDDMHARQAARDAVTKLTSMPARDHAELAAKARALQTFAKNDGELRKSEAGRLALSIGADVQRLAAF